MIRNLIQQVLPWMAHIGYDSHDNDEVRLQKTLLMLGSIIFTAAGALWGILYFSWGEYIASFIPLGYTLFPSSA